MISAAHIAVVVPCYKVDGQIDRVLAAIPEIVDSIVLVDDACPRRSGIEAAGRNEDPRIHLRTHDENQGVGGAVLTGIRAAIELGADVIVKIDGDGQMDPSLVTNFVRPILNGQADYTKGNRFFYLESSGDMPVWRRIGNLGLTFISRLSTGYYTVSDPTNGYLAIDARLAAHLPFAKLSKRYFFETDLLFRLNTMRARVLDIPHDAHYADEESGLNVGHELGRFAHLHMRTFVKRLFYQYLLRDFSVGSVFLLFGLMFLGLGAAGGVSAWIASATSGMARSGGEIALLEIAIILGTLFVIGFLNFDINREPHHPISSLLNERPLSPLKQFREP